jgi:hypothetical protein
MVMAGGQTRWLARAARDVEHVLDQIRQVELLRSVAADEAAAALGLDPNPSLGGLIAAVDEPWRSILADHREAFRATTDAITRLADENRTLISAGFRAAHETLLALNDGVQTYTPAGTTVQDPARSVHLDRSL